MLKTGQKAPDFTLNDADGQPVHLADFVGSKHVVVYFYPKDDTPGCTLEAKGFSAAADEYAALETRVLGISKDSEASHKKFCQRYGLAVTLLADPDHQVIEAYGAWQMKRFMGHENLGIVRSTYLIDKQGIIRQVWPEVTPAGHEKAVLEAVKGL